MIEIEWKPERVANLLKQMVNSVCEDGFQWYADVGEMPTVFDINHMIKILEKEKTRRLMVIDDEELP